MKTKEIKEMFLYSALHPTSFGRNLYDAINQMGYHREDVKYLNKLVEYACKELNELVKIISTNTSFEQMYDNFQVGKLKGDYTNLESFIFANFPEETKEYKSRLSEVRKTIIEINKNNKELIDFHLNLMNRK